MWAVVLGVSLWAPPSGGAVGLEWYDEAEVPTDLAERVVRSIADARGIATSDVVPRASGAAREVVAWEFPREVLDLQVSNRERLRRADEAFRALEKTLSKPKKA